MEFLKEFHEEILKYLEEILKYPEEFLESRRNPWGIPKEPTLSKFLKHYMEKYLKESLKELL